MKIFRENKSKINLCIDIIMLSLLLPVAGIGFLMKYVLISGIGRNEVYGIKTDLEFLGLTRHQWGTIHLVLSIIFLVLLILHIILHWKLIVCVITQMIPSKALRKGLTAFLAIFSLAMLISPFFIKPGQVPFEPRYRNRIINSPSSFSQNPEDSNSTYLAVQESAETAKSSGTTEIRNNQSSSAESAQHDSEYSEYEVFGYHTLKTVSSRYDVPVSYLANSLKIPENLAGEKLGFLRREYPFTMTDVRKSIADYKKK